MLIIFDSAAESIKKPISQGLMFEIVCILNFLKEVGLFRFFAFVLAIL